MRFELLDKAGKSRVLVVVALLVVLIGGFMIGLAMDVFGSEDEMFHFDADKVRIR